MFLSALPLTTWKKRKLFSSSWLLKQQTARKQADSFSTSMIRMEQLCILSNRNGNSCLTIFISAMKFTCSVEVDLPVKKTVGLFDNIANLKKWQTGLESHTLISRTPGEAGAKSKIIIGNGKMVIELTETI